MFRTSILILAPIHSLSSGFRSVRVLVKITRFVRYLHQDSQIYIKIRSLRKQTDYLPVAFARKATATGSLRSGARGEGRELPSPTPPPLRRYAGYSYLWKIRLLSQTGLAWTLDWTLDSLWTNKEMEKKRGEKKK